MRTRWFFLLAILVVLAMPAAARQSSASRQATAGGASPAVSASELIPLPPATDPGAQKAGQLLQQMVAALGGDLYLNLRTMEQTGRSYGFYHGESTGTGTLFWRFWRPPDKDRLELTKQRDVTDLFLGDEGYEITFRGTAKLDPEQLADYLRRRNHSLPWVLHNWFREPGVALLYEGFGVAERKQAEMISVITAQNDSVTIAIDSNSHLPVRVSFTWRDPKTRDRTDEAEGYDNYRMIQGIMTPLSVTRYKDGEPSNQRFITSVTYNRELADSLFAAQVPETGGKKATPTGRK
jgi:hypothetical protein